MSRRPPSVSPETLYVLQQIAGYFAGGQPPDAQTQDALRRLLHGQKQKTEVVLRQYAIHKMTQLPVAQAIRDRLLDKISDPEYLAALDPDQDVRLLKTIMKVQAADEEFLQGTIATEGQKKGFPTASKDAAQYNFVFGAGVGEALLPDEMGVDQRRAVRNLFERFLSIGRRGGELPKPPNQEHREGRASFIDKLTAEGTELEATPDGNGDFFAKLAAGPIDPAPEAPAKADEDLVTLNALTNLQYPFNGCGCQEEEGHSMECKIQTYAERRKADNGDAGQSGESADADSRSQ